MLSRCKARAKKLGVPFDITRDDLVVPDRCPVLGMAFVSGDKDAAASVDRIIPSKGYVKGNVVVISNKANRIKSNASVEEIEAVLSFFKGLSIGVASCEG
jgi:hypothetical protein